MTKHHPPPPTRFGPTAPAQPKPAQAKPAAARPAHAPPPTRFAPPAVQAKQAPPPKGVHLAPPPRMPGAAAGGVIQPMDAEKKPAELKEDDFKSMVARLGQIGVLGKEIETRGISSLAEWYKTDDSMDVEKRQGFVKQLDEAFYAQRRIYSEIDKSLSIFDRSKAMPYLSTDNRYHADLTYLSKSGGKGVVCEVKTVSSDELSAVWQNVTNARNQLQTRCVPGTYAKIRIQIANSNNDFMGLSDDAIRDNVNAICGKFNDDIPVTEVIFAYPDGTAKRFRAQIADTLFPFKKVTFEQNIKANRVTAVRPKGTHEHMAERVKKVTG